MMFYIVQKKKKYRRHIKIDLKTRFFDFFLLTHGFHLSVDAYPQCIHRLWFDILVMDFTESRYVLLSICYRDYDFIFRKNCR